MADLESRRAAPCRQARLGLGLRKRALAAWKRQEREVGELQAHPHCACSLLSPRRDTAFLQSHRLAAFIRGLGDMQVTVLSSTKGHSFKVMSDGL